MKRAAAALTVALLLAGCQSPENPPAHEGWQTASGGEPFLPAYLEMLQGKRPFPKNVCPDPQTLEDLLLPC